MSVVTYFVYAILIFTAYCGYMFGGEIFYQYMLPGIICIILLFAPLVWNAHRQLKQIEKELK
jgi:hypothetical protein